MNPFFLKSGRHFKMHSFSFLLGKMYLYLNQLDKCRNLSWIAESLKSTCANILAAMLYSLKIKLLWNASLSLQISTRQLQILSILWLKLVRWCFLTNISNEKLDYFTSVRTIFVYKKYCFGNRMCVQKKVCQKHSWSIWIRDFCNKESCLLWLTTWCSAHSCSLQYVQAVQCFSGK